MSIAVIHSAWIGGDANSATTLPADTTGATLLIFSAAWYGPGTSNPPISDSYGNTWTPLTRIETTAGGVSRVWYCAAPIVGPGHTFTIGPSFSIYTCCGVLAVSGTDLSTFGHEQYTVENSAVSSVTAGGVLPSANNALVVTAIAMGGSGHTAPTVSGYTTTSLAQNPGFYVGGGMAYLIQTTAATTTPTWAWGGTPSSAATSIVSFLPAAGGGGGITGTGAVDVTGPAIAGTGSRTVPSFTGSGALAITGPAISGSGTRTVPSFSGGGAVALSGPALAGSGTHTPPAITGTGSVAITGPAIAGTGIASTGAAVTGTGAVAFSGPAILGTNIPPARTRATQIVTEALAFPNHAPARVTLARVEVLSAPTTYARVTQEAIEVISVPPHTRASQLVAEVLSGPPRTRITQALVEVLSPARLSRTTQLLVELLHALPVVPHTRATQIVTEYIAPRTTAPVRLTQAPVEALAHYDAVPLRLSQAPVETLIQYAAPPVRLSQGAVEIIYPFGCYTYRPPPCPTDLPIDDAPAGGSCPTDLLP